MSSSFAETINSMREGTLFEVKINNDTPNNKTYADFITELEKTDTSNITLQNCGIKGKRLDSFLDAISKNKKVQQINLWFNELDDGDVKKIANFAIKNEHVGRYSLSNNNYTDEGCKYLAQAVKQGANIQNLDIANCPKVTDNMVDIFVPLLTDISLNMHSFSMGTKYGVKLESKIWSANHLRKKRIAHFKEAKKRQEAIGLNSAKQIGAISNRLSGRR